MDPITIRASNLFRRDLCPASGRAEAGVPEMPSDDSEMGVALHAVMAKKNDSARWDGVSYSNRILCEKADALRDFIIREVESEMQGAEPSFREFFEKEVSILFPGGEVPGHLDYLRYYPEKKTLLIVDYKFGTGFVEAAELNLQLRAYFAGAMRIWDNAMKVYVAAIRPRMPSEEQVHFAYYLRRDLDPTIAQVAKIYQGATDEAAPFRPNPIACRYCLAAPTCPAGRTLTDQALAAIPSAVERYEELTQAQKVELYDKAQLVAGFCESMIDRVTAEVRATPEAWSAAFALKSNGSVRSIPNVAAAFALCKERLGAAFAAKFIETCAVSVTKLQEAYAEADPAFAGLKKKDHARTFNDLFSHLIENTPKAPSVKRTLALPEK